MIELRRAVSGSDRQLDLVLLRIGVLAPADLGEIRSVIDRDGVVLKATTNEYGHAIVMVLEHGQIAAFVHHDGRVQHAVLATAS
jgi:hypothetical protein